jgi:phosphonopyruvate decarboxylase
MLDAEKFILEGVRRGYDFYSGVPCSFLKPLINHVINEDSLTYVAASNEGDAVAVASGAHLGGRKSAAIFQNSGLGNAVNPLTSLNATFKIPILVIVTLRGEAGQPDEPQHELMGSITPALLDLMKIRWEYIPRDTEAVASLWDRANAWMESRQEPFAMVMKKDTLAPVVLKTGLARGEKSAAQPGRRVMSKRQLPTRAECLRSILERANAERDVVIAGTGYTARELYALNDRPNHFYMVGSMGCASSIGLGLAIARPDLNVFVVEGDGAMLMRMGSAASTGFYSPRNLKHIVLDNQAHESTGSQETVSSVTDLAGVAESCGYSHVWSGNDVTILEDFISTDFNALSFLHLKIKTGTLGALPRPSVTPEEVKKRLMKHIESSAQRISHG